jgi:hypothetical protein
MQTDNATRAAGEGMADAKRRPEKAVAIQAGGGAQSVSRSERRSPKI